MSIQKRYESVIRQFVRQAQEWYTSNINRIIHYGSVARGEANPDSDIDLLVLWNGDEYEGWWEMTRLAFDVMVDTGDYMGAGWESGTGNIGFIPTRLPLLLFGQIVEGGFFLMR
ncbi:MAG: nucleotidyltransferase domain-containing protein [Methanoregula sp.]|jgi:predicted nucleotidyltransferase|uniref:nucleotidyltransferase family protein n=1 Tax=Methanoregula sp. TaxID=2052170 RepID=UPI0025F1EC74|nr:nucleotidyltransferase domain-containing protein [Methanoregula sp.]MCK9631814.1 nucleotidyltransferase domain-containing protein [Methanoregula sp.]